MPHLARLFLVLSFGSFGLVLAAGGTSEARMPLAAADAGTPDSGASSLPACIGVKTEARYAAVGYNHVVVLTNGCQRPATCVVSTDVNPEPQNATIPARQTVEVTTFLDSPAATFVAKVSCTLSRA